MLTALSKGLTYAALSLIMTVLVIIPLSYMFGSSLGLTDLEFTLSRFARLFGDQMYIEAILNTLVMSLAAAVLSMIIGTLLAWVVVRTDVPIARILDSLIVAPIFLAPIMFAVAWTFLLGSAGLLTRAITAIIPLGGEAFNIYSLAGLTYAQILLHVPYVYMLVAGALRGMDPSLEESSLVIGVGNLRTALHVTFPLVLPAILSSGLLVFVFCAEIFSLPAILGAPAGVNVLTTMIYMELSRPRPDFMGAAAIGVVLTLIVAGGLYLQRWITSKKTYVTITGKAYRPRLSSLGRLKYVFLLICLAYIVLALILPLFVIFLDSFLKYHTPNIRPELFTLANYEYVLLEYPLTQSAFINTIVFGASAATIGVFLGWAISYVVHKTQIRLRSQLDYLALAPLSVPSIVLGLAILSFWINSPIVIYGTPWIMLITYLTRTIPFSTRTIGSVLVQIHPELEEASRVLGGSWFKTFRRVVLPLSVTGLLSGWLLAFVWTTKELSAILLVASPGLYVIPVAIYDLWDGTSFPELSVMCVLLLIMIMVIHGVLRAVLGRHSIVTGQD